MDNGNMNSEDRVVKALQSVQLDLLAELDRVCNELDMDYCLAFGTALGAVRHHGFIPWDDDVDVYMRVDDLELLQRHASSFRPGYFLQHSGSDPAYGLMITRLRNSNTTLIEDSETNRDINHGVFIDIYPLFNSPDGGWGAKHQLVASMVYRLLLYGVAPKNRGNIMRLGSQVILHMVPRKIKKGLLRWSYSVMKRYPCTGYLSSLYGDEASIRYPEDWFFPVRRVAFETARVMIMADADSYLRSTYGDYMKLPPENARVFHHSYARIDLEKPYTEYKGIDYCSASEKAGV